MKNDLIREIKEKVALANGYESGILGSRWNFAMSLTYRTKKQLELYEEVLKELVTSLNIEKEIGGSGADSSNGDLHGVRECNVSDEAESTEAPVNGSLEKRTEAKEVCVLNRNYLDCKLWVYENSGCLNCEHHKLVDS